MKRSIIVAAAAGLVASQTLPFDRIVEAVTLAPKAPAPRPLRHADAGSPVKEA
jgi:hypothetical protein